MSLFRVENTGYVIKNIDFDYFEVLSKLKNLNETIRILNISIDYIFGAYDLICDLLENNIDNNALITKSEEMIFLDDCDYYKEFMACVIYSSRMFEIYKSIIDDGTIIINEEDKYIYYSKNYPKNKIIYNMQVKILELLNDFED